MRFLGDTKEDGGVLVSSVNGNPFEHKLNEIKTKNAERRARTLDKTAKLVIWGATDLVAVSALALGAWSNTAVAHWLGVPGYAGWVTALVIDGIWLVSLAIVQLHRREPWRALSAYQATLGMVGLSAVTNFAHGLIRFGVQPPWRGIAAGLLFALLPVSLKWLITVSTKNSMGALLKAPDARNRIKQAGQVQAELDLNEVLNPVVQRVNQPVQALEPGSIFIKVLEPQPEKVQVERVEPDENWLSVWPNSEPVEMNHKPELEPAEVQKPEPVEPVKIATRQDRVNDLAKRFADRGGQLNSVSFADLVEWYGVDPAKKSTLSALRKAGHQAYLASHETHGFYM